MRWRLIAQRGGLVLLGVGMALLALEVVLRTIDPPVEVYNALSGFHVGDARLGWRGRPDVDRRFRKLAFDARVRHGADGFRLAEPEPPPGATRDVLLLGDSFAWGWGVSQGEVMSDRLQARLGDEVAVYNRGVNAYSTGQQLLLLEDELARRHPTIVVLLFCINDFTENVDDKSYRPHFALQDGRPVPVNLPLDDRLQSAFEEWVERNLRVASFLDYQFALAKAYLRRESARDRDATPAAAAQGRAETDPVVPGRELTRALLLAMAERVRAADADLVIVFIPVADHVRDELGLDWSGAARRTLAEVAAEAGARFVDLTEPFRAVDPSGASLFIPGDGHWTAAGHDVAARVLAPLLAPSP